MGEVARVQDLGGLKLLDTVHFDRPGTIGVFLVPVEAGRFSLIETGPGSSLDRLIGAISEAGFELDGLERILVTHIHLDHAGAAGRLARLSGATVHVHHRGAPHLADPSRLLASAQRIYGAQMDRLWGEMESVPQEQLRPLYDGDTVALGDRVVEALDTPGHATHHMAFLLDDHALFAGDAAGIRFPPANLVKPALPPPEADLEAWEASVAKMRSVVPDRLLLTHYGEVPDPDEHLATLPEKNRAWADEVRRGILAGETIEQLESRVAEYTEREFERAGVSGQIAERYRVTSDAEMTAMGLDRYWRKKHPEAISRT